MELQDFTNLIEHGLIGLVVILAGLIRIPKIEINLWTLIARVVGKAINGEVIEKVDLLAQEFEKHLQVEEEDKMRAARQRILRFNDEILFEQGHSKEHYDEILEDIDIYEQYCLCHPEYKNNKAVIAIATIKDAYEECIQDHKFLVYKKHQEEIN